MHGGLSFKKAIDGRTLIYCSGCGYFIRWMPTQHGYYDCKCKHCGRIREFDI